MFAKKKEQLKKMFSLFPKQQVQEYLNTTLGGTIFKDQEA